MGVLAVLSVLALLGATHAEYSVVRHTSLAPRSKEATMLPPADFTAAITAKTPRRKSKKAALAALRGKTTPSRAAVAGSTTVAVDGSDFDDEYLTNVTVGGQHFSLIIDTGRCVALSNPLYSRF
jgi:hypothetical protein